MKKLRPLFALGAGLALAFVLACGGDKDATGGGDSGGNGSGAVAGPLDLSSTADKLAQLKSFRFDMAMKLEVPMGATGGEDDDAFGAALLGLFGDIKAEGAFVAPNNMQITMNMAGQEIGIVQIGNDAWTKFGSTWQKTTAEEVGIDIGSSPTELITEFLPQEILAGAKTKEETINGARATRYSFDKAALETLATEMGESAADLKTLTDANLDVWLNGDGIPVKILMEMAGTDDTGQKLSMNLELNVKDLNSDSIQIKPPI
ncbi:MAG: hypothetical protein GEU75_13615 [Dehalococcoidia bacterium]|nr:hypothetical protein [Dehalococcoidia bacterium]